MDKSTPPSLSFLVGPGVEQRRKEKHSHHSGFFEFSLSFDVLRGSSQKSKLLATALSSLKMPLLARLVV